MSGKYVPPSNKKAFAALLQLVSDDPTMIGYLNDNNLVDFIRLDLYDGTKLELTSKGEKFVSQHSDGDPERSISGWSGDFSRNPTGKVMRKHGMWGVKSEHLGRPTWHALADRYQKENWEYGDTVNFELNENDEAVDLGTVKKSKKNPLAAADFSKNPKKKRNPSTPGPWKIEEHKDGRVVIWGRSKGLPTAYIATLRKDENENSAENARLIVAAPTMLQALENLREIINSTKKEIPKNHEAYRKCWEAIALAKRQGDK